jgi:hypothetical protein
MTVIVLDFGNRGTVELNSQLGKFSGKSILGQRRLAILTRFGVMFRRTRL